MKRSPLRRRTGLRRARPGASPGKIPDAVRKAVTRRSGGLCEMPGCREAATDLHHRLRRSQGGRHTEGNLAHLCWHCHHVKIHGHPTWAYEQGWLIRGGVDNRAPRCGE